MLSRIANNLYWAGRYLERMEHITRCVPVLYFSALDGPKEIDHQYSLKAINELSGSLDSSSTLIEKKVLFNITFDKSNPESLISSATLARENCRGSRDILSTELWESVNTLYHFVCEYDQEQFLSVGMQRFMINLLAKVSLCKARINSTLIRNQVWSILTLGLLIERSYQILRVASTKLDSIKSIETGSNMAIETYEIGNLLKSLESYDMNRKYYKKPVDRKNALEFILLNARFPRSLLYCMERVCEHLHLLDIDQKGRSSSVILTCQKFRDELTYTSVEDILVNPQSQLKEFQDNVAMIHNALISKYFTQ